MFPFDKTNKAHEQEINKQIAAKQQLYKRVFDNPDGKDVLKDLAGRSFVKITTYDPDEKKMSLNEGRRSIYVYITNLVEKDLTQILEDLTKDGA